MKSFAQKVASLASTTVSLASMGAEAATGIVSEQLARLNVGSKTMEAQQSSTPLSDVLINHFESFSTPNRKLAAELNLQLRRGLWWFAWDGMMKVKRGVDIAGATAGVVALSPVFFAVAAAIKIEDRGSLIYTSKRVGRHGREFNFYKFRSMVEDAEKLKELLLQENESEAGVIFKMKDDPRITKVGKFIRRASLDELPQLFNVLLGDMSLVGPRPPLPKEVEQYKVGERYRLEVTPGLTCLWQVNGRSNLDFHQQVKLDREYIHDQTLFKDIKLIFQTIPAVLSGQGSY